jgi:hypothetical protein
MCPLLNEASSTLPFRKWTMTLEKSVTEPLEEIKVPLSFIAGRYTLARWLAFGE